jgi:hypothetical protein
VLTEAEHKAYRALLKNQERWKYFRWVCLITGVGIAVIGVWLRLQWERNLIELTGSMTMQPISGSQTYFASQAAVILALAHLFVPVGVFMAAWPCGRWKGSPNLILLLAIAKREYADA